MALQVIAETNELVAGRTDMVGPQQMLVWLEEARCQLERCNTLEELKLISDKTAVLAYLAEKARLGQAARNEATAISIDADIQIGKLSADLPQAQGRRDDLTSGHDVQKSKEEILSEAHIHPRYASRREELATLPQEVVEAHIAEVNATGLELTKAGLSRIAKDRRRANGDLPPANPGIDKVKRSYESVRTMLDELEAAVAVAYERETVDERRSRLFELERLVANKRADFEEEVGRRIYELAQL